MTFLQNVVDGCFVGVRAPQPTPNGSFAMLAGQVSQLRQDFGARKILNY